MAERSVTVVQEDKDKELPVIDRVKVHTVTDVPAAQDDFAEKAEYTRNLSGASPTFKRRITNDLKKFESGTFEKRRRGMSGAESKQVIDKSFLTGYDAFDVVEPPYNLENLCKIYESPSASPHAAAVNAKVSNIVGLGYKLVENRRTKRNFETIADDKDKLTRTRRKLEVHRDEVLEQLESMNEEDTFTEVLVKVWRDYEVTGNGYIEIGRKRDGKPGYFGHIPAKTLRRRRERDGYVQVSGFKVQFFANYGAGIDDEGEVQPIANPIGSDVPNEVIHISKYSPTSSYYGVPDIVSALNAVVGNEFAARFNIDYFENKAVPRYVIMLKGATLGSQAEQALLSFFETSVKGQNHRTVYIPLPGDTQENKVELKFEAIEAGIQDSSFKEYRKANISDILMAHRVPITKISVSEGVSLAGARDADKTFKEQVCVPEQGVFEKKIHKFLKELTDAFDFKLQEMSLTDENTQSQIDERRRKTGTETANEQRIPRGLPALEDGDEVFDMNAATKLAEMADKTTRRGQDKAVEAKANAASGPVASAGANASGNPSGTRQRDTQRSAGRTDSAGEGRATQGSGRTTP